MIGVPVVPPLNTFLPSLTVCICPIQCISEVQKLLLLCWRFDLRRSILWFLRHQTTVDSNVLFCSECMIDRSLSKFERIANNKTIH